MLSYTHAGLYYVYYIVAEFLAFLDDIHIHGTDGVGIEMVVYIVDVLALQLIAIVVDFVLNIEREVGIVVSLKLLVFFPYALHILIVVGKYGVAELVVIIQHRLS